MLFRGITAKIQTGCGGNAHRFEQVSGQHEAVVAQARTIAIEIKSTFRAGGNPEADALQSRREEIPPLAKLGSAGFKDVDGCRLESGESTVLRRR